MARRIDAARPGTGPATWADRAAMAALVAILILFTVWRMIATTPPTDVPADWPGTSYHHEEINR